MIFRNANYIYTFFNTLILLSYLSLIKSLANPAVILISFDGFRWDYVEKYNLSAFKLLADHGVKAESLQPCFITKTFPNHVSIVTGLYEESHGIIANHMYDPVLNSTFNLSITDSKWFGGFTPIWISNEFREGDSKRSYSNAHKSGVIFYPTSNVAFAGKYPSFYFQKYDEHFEFSKRFDKIINLLEADNPCDFIAAYFDYPDRTAHRHGADSVEVIHRLQIINMLLLSFIKEMERKNYFEKVNLIIVSDHGMDTVPMDHHILIASLIPDDWYHAVDVGVVSSIYPKQGYEDKVFNALNNTSRMHVYKKDSMPERFHYQHHIRIPPILVVSDPGYIMSAKNNHYTHDIGNHGYDNAFKGMHGIFYGRGPAFKRNISVGTIRNIDLYPLMCDILGINPLPNNGSLGRVKSLLKKYDFYLSPFQKYGIVPILSICIAIAFIFICIITYFIIIKCYRRNYEIRYTRMTTAVDGFESVLSSDEDTV